MRKPTFPTLALLSLSLAAPAHAGISVTATTTTTATMTKDASVVLDGLDLREYDFSGGVIQSDPLSEYALATDRSLVHTFDGTTFVTSATNTATLDAPDFAAVRREGRAQATYGALYAFTLKNTGAVRQTVHFDLTLARLGTAFASPFADEPDYGAYGAFELYGGVADIDAYFGRGDYENRNNFRDTFLDGSPTGIDRTYTLGHDFGLEAGERHTFYVWASGRALATYTPVPEPASLAALAVGALGLLRRRKR